MTRITLLNGEGRKEAFEFLTVDDQDDDQDDSLNEIPTVVDIIIREIFL